jgi:hypothetical protein
MTNDEKTATALYNSYLTILTRVLDPKAAAKECALVGLKGIEVMEKACVGDDYNKEFYLTTAAKIKEIS